MADRYWILGTGTWDATNTVNWSASSGGAGGASVPTASDNVYFDANSNVLATAFTVTMANTPRVCNDFTASGLDGVMTLAGSAIGLTVSGSLTFPATNFTRTYTGTTTFDATTTGKTVTTNGVVFGGVVIFNGVGGNWTLGSAFSSGTNTLQLINGTFDTSSSGNYAITAGFFSSSNANVRTINLNASTITLSLTWNMTISSNATLNAGTSTINLTSATAKSFLGGSLSYSGATLNQGGAGALTISGSNTFGNITNTYKSTGATSILFTAATTSTFTNWNASGESTRLLTIGSTTVASHTLSKASGTVSSDFLSISRSTATGGASWYAGANSTNGGNNSGWIFTAPPAPSGSNSNFLMFF